MGSGGVVGPPLPSPLRRALANPRFRRLLAAQTISRSSVLQRTVPDRMRGRVFAFYDVVWQTARLVSIGLGGIAADRLGITAVYWAGGILLLAAGGLGLASAGTTPARHDFDGSAPSVP